MFSTKTYHVTTALVSFSVEQKPQVYTFADTLVEPVCTQVKTTEKLLQKLTTHVLLLLTHLTEGMKLITAKSRHWLGARR